jgi:hypothetical protein
LAKQIIDDIRSSICPCLVFGRNNKARHFPSEVLFIDDYQALKGKVPADAAGIMINRAREEPGPNRESITTTGLRLLGFTGSPSPTLVSPTIFS